MADLQIDHRLNDIHADLRAIGTTFKDADYNSRAVAGAVGHSGLEDKVRDFATQWDDRRPKIIASLDVLWKTAEAIDTTFGDIDTSMGANLRGKN